MTINLGGTISSALNNGALSPAEGRDSSQFTKEYLDACVLDIQRAAFGASKVIVMTGTDTVGEFGDYLKTTLNTRACIVLTAAMLPAHKDIAINKASGIQTPGIHIVVTDTKGVAHTWDLNTVSIRKYGKDLNLPFITQERNSLIESTLNSDEEWQNEYNSVCPEITDTVEDITSKIEDAVELKSKNGKEILLIGYGYYNFPIQDQKIKDALIKAKRAGILFLATRTQAYMLTDCSKLTPYAPLQWLEEIGLKKINW